MKYFRYFLSIVIPFGVDYLLGSFCNNSFEPEEWTFNSRAIVCVFGAIISLSCWLLTFLFNLGID